MHHDEPSGVIMADQEIAIGVDDYWSRVRNGRCRATPFSNVVPSAVVSEASFHKGRSAALRRRKVTVFELTTRQERRVWATQPTIDLLYNIALHRKPTFDSLRKLLQRSDLREASQL